MGARGPHLRMRQAFQIRRKDRRSVWLHLNEGRLTAVPEQEVVIKLGNRVTQLFGLTQLLALFECNYCPNWVTQIVRFYCD